MKIPNDSIPEVYAAAADVYRGRISKDDAVERLVRDFPLNPTSVFNMITNLDGMLKGRTLKRAMNDFTWDYFLQHIREDFGPEAFDTALQAVEQHVDYYESLGRGNRPSLRALLARYGRQTIGKTTHPVVTVSSTLYPDDIDDPASVLIEGALQRVTVNRYERDPVARQKCIEHYGALCVVCGFDFEKRYGDIGAGFIHVHHLVDIATIGGRYQVDPVRDLRPVCPNCHAMLHQEKPAMSVERLKKYQKHNDFMRKGKLLVLDKYFIF
jgi:Predicted restriction endonuclease